MPIVLVRDVPEELYRELLVAVAESKPEDGHARPTLKLYVMRAIREQIARDKREGREQRQAGARKRRTA